MVTVTELRDMHPEALSNGAQAWRTYVNKLDGYAQDLAKYYRGFEQWHGEAADAADKHVSKLRTQLDETITVTGKIAPVLETACDNIEVARNELRRVIHEAEASGFAVADDGSVYPNMPYQMAMIYLQGYIDEYERRIGQALTKANQADAVAAAALRQLKPIVADVLPATTATAAVKPSPLPPASTSPQAINEWWNSLTPMQQESAIYHYGRELGSLPGIPTVARDRANQAGLAAAKGMLTERIDRLGGQRDLTEEQLAELKEAKRNLNGINAIENALESGGEPQQYLMKLDPSDLGRAIVALGNPDTADNVATLVPGTGSNLGGISGLMEDADNLFAEVEYIAPKETTAVISWQGYDAPQNVADAAFPEYAQNAREELDRFQEGLQATDQGEPAHHTVIGHSYGSTVVGHAARDMDLATDEIVFIGSPGVGVDHASDLNIPAENVHASKAENDIIAITNTPDPLPDPLGDDPTDNDFGANTFNTEPGPTTWDLPAVPSVEAHTSYYEPRSASIRNMGQIVANGKSS